MVSSSGESSGDFSGINTVKFLCSYGGRIQPRHPDGKLRYVGGFTRVLAVDRSVHFSDLMEKLRKFCGEVAITLRCQLPTEDLDALVSVTSDEDLAHVIEEYDRVNRERGSSLKVRAFLSPPKPKTPVILKQQSSIAGKPHFPGESYRCVHLPANFIGRLIVPVAGKSSEALVMAAPSVQYYGCLTKGNRNPRNQYLVHNGNYWQ
ncbi:hypothetical protein AMTRI_Chr06g199250 [Amborella trichopoda]|uniref:PB1 domain-containing protein n=1 Tax=Amborella trichopoda TaxID=13333 RepID=W1Q095_AMBTC|nr:uncharacterized protein LOC18442038 [Amborella trichopoda]ERN13791.1 hypothetical protein AMTR_s00049p00204490 [Amborella trichopoda]|eukprot:XP_006852324.1 uncharacterized protein LOC18442038 [Amborella trichopoda]